MGKTGILTLVLVLSSVLISMAQPQATGPLTPQNVKQETVLEMFVSLKQKECLTNKSSCAASRATKAELENYNRAAKQCAKGVLVACQVAQSHRSRIFDMVIPKAEPVTTALTSRGGLAGFIDKTGRELGNAGKDINRAAINVGTGVGNFVQQLKKNPQCIGAASSPSFTTVVATITALKPQLASVGIRDRDDCKSRNGVVADIADKQIPGLGPMTRFAGGCACTVAYE